MIDFIESSNRLHKFREEFMSVGFDAYYLRDTTAIAWLTGFEGVFDSEQAHALFITRKGAWLHTDSRYEEACRKAAEDRAVAVDTMRVSHAKWAAEMACNAFGANGPRPTSIAFEDTLTVREFHELEDAMYELHFTIDLLPLRDTALDLRAVKSDAEIQLIQKAQDITDACFQHIIGFIKAGMTEREIRNEMDEFMMRNGADGLAFPTIVATGAHAASPHAQPGDTVVQEGDCIVMDFGACYAGYCSDMTRCVFVGEPSQQLRDAYETLRDANESAEAMLKPGVSGKEAHDLAESKLEAHGFGGKMGHSLGHGVGMVVHEQPTLSPRNYQPLVPGNVVTVEPGIYIPEEFGMRLEDFGVITENGFHVFTKSTHDMVII